MTNSWAMLHDEMEKMSKSKETAEGIWMGREKLTAEDIVDRMGVPPSWMGVDPREELDGEAAAEAGLDARTTPNNRDVVIDDSKDTTFWKYSEGKILREVEAYLSGTYKGHYVGEDSKIQTLDLIDSIGDAEAFCRSSAIKYLSRFGKKDGKNPKDLLKVIHFAFLLYHFSDLPFTEDAVETFSPTGR